MQSLWLSSITNLCPCRENTWFEIKAFSSLREAPPESNEIWFAMPKLSTRGVFNACKLNAVHYTVICVTGGEGEFVSESKLHCSDFFFPLCVLLIGHLIIVNPKRLMD